MDLDKNNLTNVEFELSSVVQVSKLYYTTLDNCRSRTMITKVEKWKSLNLIYIIRKEFRDYNGSLTDSTFLSVLLFVSIYSTIYTYVWNTVLGVGDIVAIKTDMAPALVKLMISGMTVISYFECDERYKRGEFRLLWQYIVGRPKLEHKESLPRGKRVWF